jgi:hypothetical protein
VVEEKNKSRNNLHKTRKLKIITSINQMTKYTLYWGEYKSITAFHKLMSLMLILITMYTVRAKGTKLFCKFRKTIEVILREKGNKVELALLHIEIYKVKSKIITLVGEK